MSLFELICLKSLVPNLFAKTIVVLTASEVVCETFIMVITFIFYELYPHFQNLLLIRSTILMLLFSKSTANSPANKTAEINFFF